MNQEKNNKHEIDLNDTLKDSGTGVKFQDERQSKRSYRPDTPKIIQWIIKYSSGYVKDKKQATYIVLGIVITMSIISLFLFFGAIHSPSPPPADQITDVAPEGGL